MRSADPGLIWWTSIHGPASLLDRLAESIEKQESAVLLKTDACPWKTTFIELLKHRVADPSRTIETITELKQDPGEFIRRNYLPREIASSYWFTSKDTTGEFIGQRPGPFHDRILFIDNNDESAGKWLELASGYSGTRDSSQTKASLILSTNAEVAHAPGLIAADLSESYTDLDLKSFIAIICSGIQAKEIWIEYIGELAFSLCFGHPEAAIAIIDHYEKVLNDPVRNSSSLINRYMDPSMSSVQKDELIQSRVWIAQIRSVYYQLEKFRLALVCRYKDPIHQALNDYSSYYSSYSSFEQVELGTLNHMNKNHYIEMSPRDSALVAQYASARNILSHLGLLSYSEMYTILKSVQSLNP